jgi:hypothetical protein
MKERLEIDRRKGDTITNLHLHRLWSEGWSIIEVFNNHESFTVVFERDKPND